MGSLKPDANRFEASQRAFKKVIDKDGHEFYNKNLYLFPRSTESYNPEGAVPVILVDGPTFIDIRIEKRFGVDYETMPVYISALDRVLREDI